MENRKSFGAVPFFIHPKFFEPLDTTALRSTSYQEDMSNQKHHHQHHQQQRSHRQSNTTTQSPAEEYEWTDSLPKSSAAIARSKATANPDPVDLAHGVSTKGTKKREQPQSQYTYAYATQAGGISEEEEGTPDGSSASGEEDGNLSGFGRSSSSEEESGAPATQEPHPEYASGDEEEEEEEGGNLHSSASGEEGSEEEDVSEEELRKQKKKKTATVVAVPPAKKKKIQSPKGQSNSVRPSEASSKGKGSKTRDDDDVPSPKKGGPTTKGKKKPESPSPPAAAAAKKPKKKGTPTPPGYYPTREKKDDDTPIYAKRSHETALTGKEWTNASPGYRRVWQRCVDCGIDEHQTAKVRKAQGDKGATVPPIYKLYYQMASLKAHRKKEHGVDEENAVLSKSKGKAAQGSTEKRNVPKKKNNTDAVNTTNDKKKKAAPKKKNTEEEEEESAPIAKQKKTTKTAPTNDKRKREKEEEKEEEETDAPAHKKRKTRESKDMANIIKALDQSVASHSKSAKETTKIIKNFKEMSEILQRIIHNLDQSVVLGHLPVGAGSIQARVPALETAPAQPTDASLLLEEARDHHNNEGEKGEKASSIAVSAGTNEMLVEESKSIEITVSRAASSITTPSTDATDAAATTTTTIAAVVEVEKDKEGEKKEDDDDVKDLENDMFGGGSSSQEEEEGTSSSTAVASTKTAARIAAVVSAATTDGKNQQIKDLETAAAAAAAPSQEKKELAKTVASESPKKRVVHKEGEVFPTISLSKTKATETTTTTTTTAVQSNAPAAAKRTIPAVISCGRCGTKIVRGSSPPPKLCGNNGNPTIKCCNAVCYECTKAGNLRCGESASDFTKCRKMVHGNRGSTQDNRH